jgi:hypothetical protein
MLNRVEIGGSVFSAEVSEFNKARTDGFFAGGAEVFALSFNAFPEIDLRAEINGESGFLAALAETSKATGATVFCGVVTRILDLYHTGVAVCHKGRLADIADAVSAAVSASERKIKIFSTGGARVAVLVDSDAAYPINWEKTVGHADAVLCVLRGSETAVLNAALKAGARTGMPYLIINDDSVNWKT